MAYESNIIEQNAFQASEEIVFEYCSMLSGIKNVSAWVDVTTYHGDCKNNPDEILVGYVLYNDDLGEVAQYNTDDSSFSEYMEAFETGYDYSVGTVILTRKMFEKFASRNKDEEEEELEAD